MWGEGQAALADISAVATGGAIGCVIMLVLIIGFALQDRRGHHP